MIMTSVRNGIVAAATNPFLTVPFSDCYNYSPLSANRLGEGIFKVSHCILGALARLSAAPMSHRIAHSPPT